MTLLILDHQPEYLQSGFGAGSLLTLPLGVGSFLDFFTAFLATESDGEVLVMPTFDCDERYKRGLVASTSASVRVLAPEDFSAMMTGYEQEDSLLIVDPAQWPLEGFESAAKLAVHRRYLGATHAIAIETDTGQAREHVECDGDGQVKRVQRLFSPASWPEVANSGVFLSLVPARAVGSVRFRSLGELRVALVARGVLSRDIAIRSRVLDLGKREGFLSLNERMVAQSIRQGPREGFAVSGGEVLVGRGCRIASSARIVGPVVLHPGVIIEEGVAVIGPTVVGPESRLRRGAIIAQSVLARDTVVPEGVTIRHRVAPRSDSMSSVGVDGATEGNFGLIAAPANDELPPPNGHGVTTNIRKQDRQVPWSIKRLMDAVLSFIGLVALAPVLIVTAIAVKLDSHGPVFFAHRRERGNGKEFPCIKFRTMTVDAHQRQRELYAQNQVDGPQFKLANDPRITRVGRFLRATNIDEIPQLFNVLLGHMSLVGPRPSPFRENQICVSWRRARLSVRPGITGLWQVCRSDDRSEGDFHEWIYYDTMYVRHFSSWLDIKILLATIFTVGGQRSLSLSWFIRPDRQKAAQSPISIVSAMDEPLTSELTDVA